MLKNINKIYENNYLDKIITMRIHIKSTIHNTCKYFIQIIYTL